MQKRGLLILVLLIVPILLASFALAASCSDTDGGVNYYVKGIISGSARCIYNGVTQDCTGGPKTEEDICVQGKYDINTYGEKPQLNEHFCGSDGRITIQGTLCPNGCKDGACVIPPAPLTINLTFVSKASGRYVMTDMVAWNNKLYYGTNDHGTCEDKGEVYTYPCKIVNNMCPPIANFDYFKQQGMGYVRYGNNNIIVPGRDPTSDNNYELFVYDGSWHRHRILSDPGGHLVDAVYFNNKYYVLTNHGLVVVKNPTDYNSEGTRLSFEAESYEQKLELGPAQPSSLTVWNNQLYLTGPKQPDCNPKTDTNCSIEYFIWRYNGQGNVREYVIVQYNLNFGISKEFNSTLYVKGNKEGLYKTQDGFNYSSIEFFKSFVPSSQESREISDIAVLDDKIYASVIVGSLRLSGRYQCNNVRTIFGTRVNYETLNSVIIKGYEIYSSKDGENWTKVFSKDVFVKNYPDINFPMEVMNGKLYVGMTDSSVQGSFLNQFINLYVYDPTPVPVPTNATCTDSDGGVNYYVKGIISGSARCIYNGVTQDCTGGPKTEEDICVQGKYDINTYGEKPQLNEHFCGSDGRITIQGTLCPNGCSDGACIQVTQTCTDSDKGKNPLVKGSTTVVKADGTTETNTDSCNKDLTLKEWYCQDNAALGVNVKCPAGYYCTSGACKRFFFTRWTGWVVDFLKVN